MLLTSGSAEPKNPVLEMLEIQSGAMVPADQNPGRKRPFWTPLRTSAVNANNEDETTDSDPSDDGNPNSADNATANPVPSVDSEFLIDSDIDINSAALLDMISEEVSKRSLQTSSLQLLHLGH